MLSEWIIYILLAFYAIIAGAAAWERNWPRALYYVAAILIQISVLWATTKARTT